MDILLDASALMAIILNEPNKDIVIELTKNAALLSPDVIIFEIGNALINLYKRNKITEEEVLEAYKTFTAIPLRATKTNVANALKIACKYKIYAYDAYYLETAYRLKLPLITFDEPMQKIGAELNIAILKGGIE
jgi:predicted nucleic acid-binding protein